MNKQDHRAISERSSKVNKATIITKLHQLHGLARWVFLCEILTILAKNLAFISRRCFHFLRYQVLISSDLHFQRL